MLFSEIWYLSKSRIFPLGYHYDTPNLDEPYQANDEFKKKATPVTYLHLVTFPTHHFVF